MIIIFGIDESLKINQFIAKKNFYDNADMSGGDKKLFTDNIRKITLISQLQPNNTNIKAYKDKIREYPLMNIINVAIERDTKLKRIAEIIMRAIPYPMLLVFTLDNKTQLWTAHQRINQSDNTKNTLEEFVNTGWSVESEAWSLFDIMKMDMTNFYTLYSGIVDAISIYNYSLLTNRYPVQSGAQARELTAKIEELDKQITTLKSKAKKETQFNKMVEMKLEMKKLEQMKKEILGV